MQTEQPFKCLEPFQKLRVSLGPWYFSGGSLLLVLGVGFCDVMFHFIGLSC